VAHKISHRTTDNNNNCRTSRTAPTHNTRERSEQKGGNIFENQYAQSAQFIVLPPRGTEENVYSNTTHPWHLVVKTLSIRSAFGRVTTGSQCTHAIREKCWKAGLTGTILGVLPPVDDVDLHSSCNHQFQLTSIELGHHSSVQHLPQMLTQRQ